MIAQFDSSASFLKLLVCSPHSRNAQRMSTNHEIKRFKQIINISFHSSPCRVFFGLSHASIHHVLLPIFSQILIQMRTASFAINFSRAARADIIWCTTIIFIARTTGAKVCSKTFCTGNALTIVRRAAAVAWRRLETNCILQTLTVSWLRAKTTNSIC